MKVSFTGISPIKNQNCPILAGKYFTASQYIPQMIKGYSWAYDHLSHKAWDILEQTDWWNKVSHVRSRSVIRDTAAYAYLLRRVQQPDLCKSKTYASLFIKNKLSASPYMVYETEDLLTGNIPYFYHTPGEKHFYDGKGFCYVNSFAEKATDSIRSQFNKRSEEKKHFDCKILEKHLRGIH